MVVHGYLNVRAWLLGFGKGGVILLGPGKPFFYVMASGGLYYSIYITVYSPN